MNHDTEKNDNRTEPAASTPAKRSWHAPEIDEVDFAETQSGVGLANDGSSFAS
jgi:hypothetical protein